MPKKSNNKTIETTKTIVTPATATPAASTNKKAVTPKTPRILHSVTDTYKTDTTIQSLSFGKKRSRTRINPELFNTLPDATITYRDETFLRALKATYNTTAFPRADADAGNLRRAIERGYIKYVSGDTASESCLFQLTPKAIKNIIA